MMLRGLKGEKRPADVIGNAVRVMRIATGEIEKMPLKMRWIWVAISALVIGTVVIAAIASVRSTSPPSRDLKEGIKKIDAYIASANRLLSVTIEDWTWRKEVFGVVAAFTIKNQNDFAVKDVKITCEYSGNSGTIIDHSVQTVYDVVPPNSSKTIRNFNMGFVNTQATQASCLISGFL